MRAPVAPALVWFLVLACDPTADERADPEPEAPTAEARGEDRDTPVEPVARPQTEAPRPDPALDHLPRIPDSATWQRLAARSREHAVARAEVVKLLVDLEQDRVYFCQSDRWPIHYDFAVRFLSDEARPFGDRRSFNTRHYLRSDRRFIMATLVHYRDGDLWTMELGPADNLGGERVLATLERVVPLVFFGERLAYRPRSELHGQRIAGLGARLPTVSTDAVFQGVRYQPLTTGATVGWLRLVHGPLDPATVRPDQILVTEEVPDDMPLSAGLVTSKLQTPLAHVAVLSQGRGTPNMALRGAVEHARFAGLDGRLARLTVDPDDFTLGAATEAEARAAWQQRRPERRAAPARDLGYAALRDLCTLRLGDAVRVGAKAAQLAEVCQLDPPVRTPGGFVLPFHHYGRHLDRHGVDVSTAALRRTPGFGDDLAVREARLAALRARIEEAEVDPALVAEVLARLQTHRDRRHIFRSSTNAEDLVGFSGAGLYRSVVVEADPDEAAVAIALARVWASVYTLRAFEEREWYRVEHDAVAMAVLVQPFVEDVVATGVAVTENPFSTQRSAFFVNLQSRGGSVTATTDELPEQILIYRRSRPEILSRSSRTGGAPILTAADIAALRDVLGRIHDRFVPGWGGEVDAADVELLITRRPREVVILQTRPYTVRRRPAG